MQLDELGTVDRQFQVENIVLFRVESDAAHFRAVQRRVDAEHHLLVQHQHLRLALGDVRLQFAPHLAREVTHDLIHQLAHDVRHFVRRVEAGQLRLRHTHVQHVALVDFHRRIGGKIEHDQARETAIEHHEAADVRLQARLGDALHHA
ncbi:hypothetical protein D3C72_1743780 [compost metagenome]